MRLFIAINFEERVKKQISNLIDELRKTSTQGKFVNEEHMHLTLEFLGEIEKDKVDIIKTVLNSINISAFTIELSNIGYFKRREGNIYWLGIKENKSLLELQSNIHKSLTEHGFTLEDRPYKPHITLGRKVIMNEDFNPNSLTSFVNDINIKVNSVELMKSENMKGKLMYTIAHSKNLQ
jgi:2'-5' RNA ligase